MISAIMCAHANRLCIDSVDDGSIINLNVLAAVGSPTAAGGQRVDVVRSAFW